MSCHGREDAATVLVVEDEALLRLDMVDCLEEAGFAVLEAADADEAVRILERRDDVRLVFTDVDMPGSMDGLKLAAYVRNRWPPIKLIVTSGQITKQEAHMPSGGRFFSKPYDGPLVARAIREMIAG
jgi:CheY-like chemotaxis protein